MQNPLRKGLAALKPDVASCSPRGWNPTHYLSISIVAKPANSSAKLGKKLACISISERGTWWGIMGSTAMSEMKRPVSVVVVACVYLLVGTVGFVLHFRDLFGGHWDGAAVELTEALAVVAGAFLLRRQNWARWLALAWMAFHVAISIPGPMRALAMHSLIFLAIAWVLLRPEAGHWFGKQAAGD